MITKLSLHKAILFFILLIFSVSFGSVTHPSMAASVPITRYVATTGSDNGDCSSTFAPCRTVQYAVNQSFSGDRILVAKGTYDYNSVADSCTFLRTRATICFVDKSLTILGGYSTTNWSVANPIANLTVIDGKNTYRGVAVIGYNSTTAHLNMQGFTIKNGRAQGPTSYDTSGIGGGMLVQHASIILKDISFKNNQAIGQNTNFGDGGPADGAGLRIESSPTGTISLLERVIFENNQSYGGSGPDRGGIAFGALFIYDSTVIIEDSIFTNNIAQAGSSSGSGTSSRNGLHADALGGGISVENSAVTLRRISVTENQISGGNANSIGGGAFGAGIFVEGAFSFTSSLIMSDAYVANNTATAGNAATGGNAAGGGIVVTNSLVDIDRVEVISNTAIGGSSTNGENPGPGAGGGAYIFATRSGIPDATIKNMIIADNLATQGSGNKTAGNGGGGGIVVHGMAVDFNHVTIARNQISSPLVLGQGLVVQPWALSSGSLLAAVNLSNSIIAYHTEGGTIASAIVVQQGSTLTFNQGLFAGNVRDTNANGIPVPAGTIIGLNSILSVSSAGFISPGSPNYNYHLRSDSEAKDLAATSTASEDIDGQSRPNSGVSDLGADEYWPFLLSVTPGDGTLGLDWTMETEDLTDSVSHYDVLVTCVGGGNPPVQGNCGQPINVGTATRFTLTGLSNFKEYGLIVYARDTSQNIIATSTSITISPTNLLIYIPMVVK